MSTTYSSQGKTAKRVLALMSEKTTNKEAFYVAVSRAKHGLTLYAADKHALIRQAQVSRAKENASDYVTLSAMASEKSVELEKEQSSTPTSAPNRYAQLWQKYSAGVSARNPVEFDYRVGRRAVLDGCNPKTVTLMVVAGSEMVRQIREQQGKQQAMEYARKTVIAASRGRHLNNQHGNSVRRREAELGD